MATLQLSIYEKLQVPEIKMKLSLSKINRLATLKVSGKECISKLFDVLLVWKPIAIKKKSMLACFY